MEGNYDLLGAFMQCAAISKRSRKRCNKNAIKNKRVCRIHGGCTPKRNPKLSLTRLPYLSEFAKSTIGTEILHAIRYANQSKLCDLHAEIVKLQGAICQNKVEIAESPDLKNIRDLFETEKTLFETLRNFNNAYFAAERKIRLVSTNWLFHSFENIIRSNLANQSMPRIIAKMNRLYLSLIFPNREFENPILRESRESERAYLSLNFQMLIQHAVADRTDMFGASEILKIILYSEEIKMIDDGLRIMPVEHTVDDLFRIYQAFEGLIVESFMDIAHFHQLHHNPLCGEANHYRFLARKD